MTNDEQITYIGKLKKVRRSHYHLTVPDVPFFHVIGSRKELEKIAEPILAEMIHGNKELGFQIPKPDYLGERLESKEITNYPIKVIPRPNAINESHL